MPPVTQPGRLRRGLHRAAVVGTALFAVAVTGGSNAARAQTVIFSNIASSDTSLIPGLNGVRFAPPPSDPDISPGAVLFTPYASPDGSRWILRATADSVGGSSVVIAGGGTSAADATVVYRGTGPSVIPGANWAIAGTSMGINNTGQFALAADTTAPTAGDFVVVRGSVGSPTLELIAREGTAPPGGTSYGSALDSVHILNDGTVRFRSSGSPVALYSIPGPSGGGVEIARVGTGGTVPGGQFSTPANRTLGALGTNRFRSSADGLTTMYTGNLSGLTNSDIIVRNGQVVAQRGFVLPNSGFTDPIRFLGTLTGHLQMSSNGQHYLFRGDNVREGFDNSADLTDWVYRNGEVVAATDRPIFAGATERWSDSADSVFTFIANVTNNLGEYVIAGTTDSSDLDRDLVFVFNGTTEVLREGDPVDVNGDGVFDDDAFLDGSILDYDDAFLTDAGIFHFNARLRNGAGEYLGQAFMAKDLRAVSAAVPEPGSAGLLAAPAAVGLLLATVRRRRRLRA